MDDHLDEIDEENLDKLLNEETKNDNKNQESTHF